MRIAPKGFSLVELMIVIGILGILFSAVQIFSNNAEIYQQRADRLAGLVYDTIRDARQDTIIGRGVLSGEITTPHDATYIRAENRQVFFSSNIQFSTHYTESGTTYTGQIWNAPFFDGD